jgi:hypothetical protein
MNYFAGLDVSVKDTSVCIVDEIGKIVREVRVASEPEALLVVLKNLAYRFKRIGLEAGPLSQWLFSALERGIAVRQGLRALRTAMPNVLAMTDKLSPRMIHMIEDLCTDWRYLDSRIVTVSNEIETLSEQDDGAKRLMTVPGIGPVVVAAPWADRLIVSARTSGGHREREGVSLFIVDRHAPNVEDGVQQCLILGAASVGLCTPLIGCRSGGLGRP